MEKYKIALNTRLEYNKLAKIKWDNKHETFRTVALKQHMKYI